MKLRDVCKKIHLQTDGLNYAAGCLSINLAQDITGRDLERIYLFLKTHSPYSPAIMEALQAVDPEEDDGVDFWTEVKNAQQTDRSSIKHITVSTSNFVYAVAGIKYFKATKTSEGKYLLEAREVWTSEFCEAVYWLPYIGRDVAHVNRAVYEYDTDIDFFLTLELSGCRFTVTDQSVYHVAYDADAGLYAPSSNSRTSAEKRKMQINGDNDPNPRRLSIGGDDSSSYNYGISQDPTKSRATVIGVRRGLYCLNQEWVYKAFMYHSLAWVPNSEYYTMVQILDNTKYENDSLWARDFQ